MENFRNYYSTLGITREADADTIKKAFRRLARQYHPDLNPGDKDAEEKFKAVGEAYEVLGDPDKRAKYDQFRFFWQGQQSDNNPRPATNAWGVGQGDDPLVDYSQFPDFNTFVEELLGRKPTAGGTSRSSGNPPRSASPEFDPARSTPDRSAPPGPWPSDQPASAYPSSPPPRRDRPPADPDPRRSAPPRPDFGPDFGSNFGPDPRSGPYPDPRFNQPRSAAPDRASDRTDRTPDRSALQTPDRPRPKSPTPGHTKTAYTIKPLPPRRDAETDLEIPLERAYRGGLERVRLEDGRSIEVEMPGGMVTGQQIRLRGQGINGGDLYLRVRVPEDPVLKLRGSEVFCAVQVSPAVAVLGKTVMVPTLDGPVQMQIPAGVRSGQRLRLKGKGYPQPQGRRGDQIVEVQVVIPQAISPKAQALYEQLYQLEQG